MLFYDNLFENLEVDDFVTKYKLCELTPKEVKTKIVQLPQKRWKSS